MWHVCVCVRVYVCVCMCVCVCVCACVILLLFYDICNFGNLALFTNIKKCYDVIVAKRIIIY